MVVAAILAGGSGLRMGSDIPKQYLCVGDIPVIVRSISAFVKNPRVDMCIVCVAHDYINYTKDLIKEHILTNKEIVVISGGSSRGKTLVNVLTFMKEKEILSDSIILTHDAVRPFINDRIINENIDAAEKYGACNTCVPAVDTIFVSNDNKFIDFVPPRETVFHAQTPQSFKADILYKLINSMPTDVYESLTDGCSVFRYHKKDVYMVKGEYFNIKITYPDDISRAQIIASKIF